MNFFDCGAVSAFLSSATRDFIMSHLWKRNEADILLVQSHSMPLVFCPASVDFAGSVTCRTVVLLVL